MKRIKTYTGEELGALTAAALKKALAIAEAADSKSTAEVIAEGNGHMRFSDMREAVANGTASDAVKSNLQCWEAVRDLRWEISRRMNFHSSLKRTR